MEANLVNGTGLVFDMVGAYLVVSSLVFAKTQVVKAQALTVVGGNPALEFALMRQQEDARFGLSSLMLGFGLQLIAALGVSAPITAWHFPAMAVLFVCLVYRIRYRRLKDSPLGQQAKEMMAANADALDL